MRRFCCLGVALLAWGATAQNLRFVGQSDKSPIEYALNEPMVFTVRLIDLDEGLNSVVPGYTLRWTRIGDDGLTDNGSAPSDKPLVVTTSIAKPGFVRLTVNIVDSEGEIVSGPLRFFEGGAGADVWNIPERPAPSDFTDFWRNAVDGLLSTPYTVTRFEPCADDAEVNYYAFEVTTFDGEYPATGVVAWPKDAKDGTLDLQASCMAYGECSRTPLPSRETVLEGHVLATLCRHGEDPVNESDSYYQNRWWLEFYDFCFRNNEGAVQRTDYYKMLMRDLRSLQFLKTLPIWNRTGLKMAGTSMGGYQALGCTALDKDVTACSLTVPWSADLSGAKDYGRVAGWRPDWTPALDYVDLKNLASLVTAPVTMTVGLGDTVCPPSGEALVYRNLKSTPRKITFLQDRGHDVSRAVVPQQPSVGVPGAAFRPTGTRAIVDGETLQLTAARRFDLWEGAKPVYSDLRTYLNTNGDVGRLSHLDWKAGLAVSFDRDVAADTVTVYERRLPGIWTASPIPALHAGEQYRLPVDTALDYATMLETCPVWDCGVKTGLRGVTMRVDLELHSPADEMLFVSIANGTVPLAQPEKTVWFDAHVGDYATWTEDAAFAVGGEWSADDLRNLADVSEAGALQVSTDETLEFVADRTKEVGGDVISTTVEADVEFAAYNVGGFPQVASDYKGGVLVGRDAGVDYYYGLAKVGSANAWVKLDAPSPKAEGLPVKLKMTFRKGPTGLIVVYNIDGQDCSLDGSCEVALASDGMISAVTCGGNGTLHSLAAMLENFKRGLILLLK